MTPFDLSTFTLDSVVLECKYDEAFLLWDRSGQLWQEVRKGLPGIKMNIAEPNRTKFHLDDSFELSVEIQRFVVAQHRPAKDLKRFIEVATTVADSVTEVLKIADFSRVGFRQIYWREMESVNATAQFVLGLGLIRTPDQRNPFGKDASVQYPEVSVRFEGATMGATTAIKAQRRRLQIDVPLAAIPHVERKNKNEETDGVLQDVDVFTKGITAVEQVRPVLWVDNAANIGRRALKVFWEGVSK